MGQVVGNGPADQIVTLGRGIEVVTPDSPIVQMQRQRDDDPLDVEHFATHRLSLTDAAHAYEIFQKKQDGAIKIVLHP